MRVLRQAIKVPRVVRKVILIAVHAIPRKMCGDYRTFFLCTTPKNKATNWWLLFLF